MGDTGGDIEHDDGTVALFVVFITQCSDFFLPNFPDIEFDESFVGVEDKGMPFASKGGNVFCTEFSR